MTLPLFGSLLGLLLMAASCFIATPAIATGVGVAGFALVFAAACAAC